MRALIMSRESPLLEIVDLSHNHLTEQFTVQLADMLIVAIESAKQEAMLLVSSLSSAGELGNQNTQLDTLAHLAIKKIELTGNKIPNTSLAIV